MRDCYKFALRVATREIATNWHLELLKDRFDCYKLAFRFRAGTRETATNWHVELLKEGFERLLLTLACRAAKGMF